ncbi:MAG: chorismate-binding protein [Paramuribaculum sp.]|nr:chorismate-binding protein [Paramuribaculum sp.]
MSQLIPETIRKAAERAISLNLPFVLYALPGESEVRFMASRPHDGENRLDITDRELKAFVITMFAAPASSAVGIKAEMTAEDVLALPDDMPSFDGPQRLVRPLSTEYAHYLANFHEAQKGLRYSTKKVVLSRRLAFMVSGNATQLAEEYFTELPDTFRALYFTQETGLWITATPEQLLNYDATTSTFRTMALAGTQSMGNKCVEGGEEWDEKNTLEHDLVVEHIKQVFYGAGLATEVSEPTVLKFGEVGHLCHRIKGFGQTDVSSLLDRLNPTPAVAGYPVNKTLELIERYEPHPRLCYGGWLGLKNGQDLDLYVNLRSAMLEPGEKTLNINIICGGGILRASKPEAEWKEAGMKAGPLWNVIREMQPTDIYGAPVPHSYHPADIPEEWMKFRE